MIGGHAQNGIVCTVDLCHDILEVDSIFKFDNPYVNNINDIHRQ